MSAPSGGRRRIMLCGDPVISLDEPAVVPDGAVVIEGNRVVDVGPRTTLERRHGPVSEVLGGADHIVLPGLINAHSHTGPSLGPGLFDEVFEKVSIHMGPGNGPVPPELVRLRVMATLLDAIRCGQTAMVDFNYGRWGMPWFAWDVVLDAYREIGIRVGLGVVFRDQNRYAHEPDDTFLRRFEPDVARGLRASRIGYAWPIDEVTTAFTRLADEWHGRDERIHVIVAPDWTPACSDALYQSCRRLADEYDTVMSTHVLETRSEMIWNLRTHGVVATRRLADLGVLGPDVSFAHFVWATDEDIRILADTGVVAVTNPGSNLRLSSGIARLRDIMDAGGRVAIGTDAISFSDREDLLVELRLAAYLARTPHSFESCRLDSLDLLRAMGDHGAAALGWPGELGRLAPGCLADAVVLDSARILHPRGRYDSTPILDVLLDRADHTDVVHVIVNGNVIVHDRIVTTVDEAEIRTAIDGAIEATGPPTEAVREGRKISRLAAAELASIYEPWYEVPLEPASIYNVRIPPRP